MATPAKPSSLPGAATGPTPQTVRKQARALLTSVKDFERTVAVYAGPPVDKEGLELARSQLRLLARQVGDLQAGLDVVVRG